MNKFQAVLAAIAAAFATIAGLDLTGITALLPPDLAKWGVVVPSAAAAVVHIIDAIRKAIGDETNPSGGDKLLIALAFAIIWFSPVALTSCTTTTLPDGTTIQSLDPAGVDLAKEAIKSARPVSPQK